ncbi:kinase-like domain-containing protein [Phaeosphaeriaceae sp. PMI808]|nr:kinase-like domain-containing protein [Phaeosphaeriaceae sp. PMI808]
MARNRTSFRDLRDTLYKSLVTCVCIPQLEIDGRITDQLEKRFFPAGTAEKILTPSVLEQLFISIITPTGQAHVLGVRPSQLVQQVEARKLHVFLAILITSKCDSEALLSFIERLVAPRTWTDTEHRLAKLPVEDINRLRPILGDDPTADLFLQRQHDFFAPIIQKNKEVRGHFRRVPYKSEKLIGQGSFGKIYAVVISPKHFQDSHFMSNEQELKLARKDFELNTEDRAYEKERDILQAIVRNAKSHNNIMKSLGSLENGLTYSLFMPLADCDLKQYMELHPEGPQNPLAKAKIVQCAVGLAGAIVYLHEALESPDYEKLSCFHMDLKPQNILVVIDPNTREEQWKLSDFNMSRVKMRRKHTDEQMSLRRSLTFGDNVYEINRLFRRRFPDATDNSVTDYTINRRGTGTYLAPEACVENHPVHAESDTWSLGCVISVVFSYLSGGQAAVDEFAELRYKQGLDRFFTFSGAHEPQTLNNAQVSDAVKRWHKQLRLKTSKANTEESAIFENMIRFLGRKVLIIDPRQRQRTTAAEVREELITSFKAFQAMSSSGPISPKSPKSRLRLPSLIKRSWRRQAEIDVQSQDWRIPLAADVRTCVFGPNAQPLVCLTDNTLSAYSLEHVLLSDDSNEFEDDLIEYGQVSPEKGRKWIPSVGVSTQFIMAATDHQEFDCYFYHIAQLGNHNSKLEQVNHWQLALPRIRKLAISPDAQYAAFVLFSTKSGQNSSLYITRLEWLQDAHSESRFYSIVSSSTASSSSPGSPLGRPIPLPCPAEDICELSFSGVNGVYVVAKPSQSNGMTENVMHVFAWTVEGGRRTALAPSPIKHKGKDDLLQGLFTCFAVYNQTMAFALVSQENRVIIRAWGLERYSQSTARGYRILQILLDQQDQDVLAFGTRQAHNELQLLTFPAANTRDELDIKHERKLPGMTYQSKFVAAITSTSKGPLTERLLLIAIMEGSCLRIVRIGL